MIKTPAEREDISAIMDEWEQTIESKLDGCDITQEVHAFQFYGRMSNETIQELEARYKQAGWHIMLFSYSLGVDMRICTLEEFDKCTD